MFRGRTAFRTAEVRSVPQRDTVAGSDLRVLRRGPEEPRRGVDIGHAVPRRRALPLTMLIRTRCCPIQQIPRTSRASRHLSPWYGVYLRPLAGSPFGFPHSSAKCVRRHHGSSSTCSFAPRRCVRSTTNETAHGIERQDRGSEDAERHPVRAARTRVTAADLSAGHVACDRARHAALLGLN